MLEINFQRGVLGSLIGNERGEGLAGIVVAMAVVALAATSMLLAASGLNPALRAGANQDTNAEALAVVREELLSPFAYDAAAAISARNAGLQSIVVAVPLAGGTPAPVTVVAQPNGGDITLTASQGEASLAVTVPLTRAAPAPGNIYGP